MNGDYERLAIERDGPIGVAHDHGRVEQFQTVLLVELADLRADLIGPLHVVVSNGPQVRALNHGRSSGNTINAATGLYFAPATRVETDSNRSTQAR
jgi:hypothetical protein